jgi:hypothetical protein
MVAREDERHHHTQPSSISELAAMDQTIHKALALPLHLPRRITPTMKDIIMASQAPLHKSSTHL